MNNIKNEYRIDGRKSNEIRTLNISLNPLRFSQGQTMLILDFKPEDKLSFFIDFMETAKNERQTVDGIIDELLNTLKKTFEQVVIDNVGRINITIVQDDGSLLSTIINGVSILLCINGAQMKDIIISMTAGKGSSVIVDLNRTEEKIQSKTCIAFTIHKDKILFFESNNTNKIDLKEVYNECKKAGNLVFEFITDFLTKDKRLRHPIKTNT